MSTQPAVDAMHVWDLPTIYAVQRLGCVIYVDEMMIARDIPHAVASVRTRLAKQIARAAGELRAVVVDLDDVAIEERERPHDASDEELALWPSFTKRFAARWSPRTRTCILRGGPEDGAVLDVPEPWRGVTVAVAPPLAALMSEDDSTASITLTKVHYSVAGWSEHHRHWILAP